MGAVKEQTVILGDRMNTDILGGIESDIDTVLVLSGVTKRSDLKQFSFSPSCILQGVDDLLDVLVIRHFNKET